LEPARLIAEQFRTSIVARAGAVSITHNREVARLGALVRASLRDMAISIPEQQDFGQNPLTVRETDQYQKEYVQSFAAQWDQLIDCDARAKSEGRFFVEILKAREKTKILDVATGT
jgi:hypothetical protein